MGCNPFKKDQSARTDWIETGLQDGTLLHRPELITENKASVLLFIGCTATFDEKVSRIAKHTVNILSRAGVEFGVLGTEENCCYGKLRRMGDPSFKQLAGQNIEKLNSLGFDTLVSACAGCFKTLNADYPKVGQQKYKIYHLSECPTCFSGLSGGALKAGSHLKVVHMAELAARSMGIGPAVKV